MPNNQTKKLTHGAMMIALFVILVIVAVYVPLIQLVAMLIAPLPLAWFSSKYERTTSIFVGVVGCITTFFFGGLIIFIYSIFFAMCGIIMGDVIRSKKSKVYLLMATSIAILAFLSISYIIAVKMFEIDFVKEAFQLAQEQYTDSYELAEKITGQKAMNEENLDAMYQLMEMLVPACITLGVFFYSFIIISVNLPILKRLKVAVPKFNDFKNLRLPRAVLWIYLIVLSIEFFVRPELGSTLSVIELNFNVVLQVLFIIQGLSFLYFVVDANKLPKFLSVIATILVVPLSTLLLLVGILDLGFDVRSYVTRKIQK